MSAESVALSFAGLERRFGALRVLRGVDGDVRSGATLAVIGGNGSGKSTLLRCLAGLLRPDAGRIEHVEGGASLSIENRRRRVGYVAPDVDLYAELTAEENLKFFARLRGAPADAGIGNLDRLDVPRDRRFAVLSSGLRQRARWAWALLGNPRVLLLDEPFQNLDAEGETSARLLLAEHLESGGLAVVASPTAISLPGVRHELALRR